MSTLTPYTNTYTDVNDSIMDADDLVNEFWRVAYFLNLWGGSIDAIGQEDHFEAYVEIVTGELAEILPARGLIQRLEVEAGVETFEIRITEHTTGAPFRVYIIVRCRSADTRFTISGPAGEAHLFGLNRETFMPAQVLGDEFYTATIICTYGSERGVMIQVQAGNPEETAIDYDDIQTAVPL